MSTNKPSIGPVVPKIVPKIWIPKLVICVLAIAIQCVPTCVLRWNDFLQRTYHDESPFVLWLYFKGTLDKYSIYLFVTCSKENKPIPKISADSAKAF